MSNHDLPSNDGEKNVDSREGVDRPDVHNEKGTNDSFDEDLARDSRDTPRGGGNDKPLTDPTTPPASR